MCSATLEGWARAPLGWLQAPPLQPSSKGPYLVWPVGQCGNFPGSYKQGFLCVAIEEKTKESERENITTVYHPEVWGVYIDVGGDPYNAVT